MSAAAADAERIIGIGELALVVGTGGLVTHALGSCLGLLVHDPVAEVAGLMHAMLPEVRINPERAEKTPGLFVESGVPLLFQRFLAEGGRKSRAVVKAAGCASPLWAGPAFQIGKRNFELLLRILEQEGLRLAARDVGGAESRTMRFDLRTGETILSRGKERWTL